MNDKIEIIKKAAIKVLGDATIAEEWLSSPIPVFNGRTPIEAVLAGDYEYVLSIIKKIESGEFT